MYGQRFTVKPEIRITMDKSENLDDTSKYGFEWYVIDPAFIPVTSAKVVLSTQHILDTVLTLRPGANYTLNCKITDKKTGVKWTGTALLTVTTSIFEGWLALCEVNGESRLDMATYANSNYKLVPGVLDSVGSGLSMKGRPLNIAYTTQAALLGNVVANGIYVSTTQGTNRIDPETFKWSPNLNIQFDMLASLPPGFAADLVVPGTPQANYLHSMDSNVYWHYRPLQKNWGAIINVVTGESEPFKAAPFIALPSNTTSFGSIIFDTGKKRFLRHLSTAASSSLMPSTGMTLFNYNNMGMDLVYMAHSPYNGGEVYSVFKNSATNKFYLARFTLGTSINQTYYAEITGTDITKAELFAVNPDYGYLFYNVGGKVYEYDLGLKKSFLMIDKGTSSISVLKFHPFLKSTYATIGKKLVVASYDPSLPSASCGTLELYNVAGINGALSSFLSLQGFGKIKSLTYRER
jgi:hypothetical protein